jgi:hypothetical protein
MSEKTPEQLLDEKINKYVPLKVKFFAQRVIHGFDETDMLDPREKIVNGVLPLVDSFAAYQREHGLRLPIEFANNPAGWLDTVQKISQSFNMWKLGKEYTDAEKRDMKEGFILFGKYFIDLWEKEKNPKSGLEG